MGLWKFLKGIFGAKETETCPTPEVKVPVVKAEEIKKEVVKEVKQEVPVQAEETKVTAKEIKAKRTPAIKKTEVKAEEVSTEVVAEKKAKPRRRRKPKAKPENGDQA
jgi:hypothetical protein